MTRTLACEIANRSSESCGHVVGCVEGKNAGAMTASTKARSTPGPEWMAWNAIRQAFRGEEHLWVRVEPGARTARRHARCAPARIRCVESSGCSRPSVDSANLAIDVPTLPSPSWGHASACSPHLLGL